MKHCLISFLSIIIAIATYAQAPASYYSSLNGLKQSQLKDALYLMLDLSVYDKAAEYIGRSDLKTTVLGSFVNIGSQRASGVRIVAARPACFVEPRVSSFEF